jgi:hypothetical protein
VYLLLKVGSRYACWNSYKACWYLGPLHLSEIFARCDGTCAKRALAAFPNGRWTSQGGV